MNSFQPAKTVYSQHILVRETTLKHDYPFIKSTPTLSWSPATMFILWFCWH